MSKSYVHVKPALASILANHIVSLKSRLSESDCHIEKNRDFDLSLDDVYCSLTLIEALEDVMEQNEAGNVHADYQSDMNHMKAFLSKLKADQARIEEANKKATVICDQVRLEMNARCDEAIKELLQNDKLYSVRVRTSKLSEDQAKAVVDMFKANGFEGGHLEGTTWSLFYGLFEGDADTLRDNIISFVPNSTKNFMREKVKVKEEVGYESLLVKEIKELMNSKA